MVRGRRILLMGHSFLWMLSIAPNSLPAGLIRAREMTLDFDMNARLISIVQKRLFYAYRFRTRAADCLSLRRPPWLRAIYAIGPQP